MIVIANVTLQHGVLGRGFSFRDLHMEWTSKWEMGYEDLCMTPMGEVTAAMCGFLVTLARESFVRNTIRDSDSDSCSVYE